ncbi:cytolytic toxin-alpha-like [Asterias amurensis]|uniref:cytolytic toxin-alpha-like n=1 Tax=Asterias amurensis TaxID=7602 RepID=UPI003AB567B2
MATPKSPNKVHKEFSMATAGRNIQLGMLYNCFDDQSVTGFTIWDQDEIQTKRKTDECPKIDYSLIAEESEGKNTQSVDSDYDLSLRVGVVCGFVKAEGSWKYLNENNLYARKKNNIVTLRCKVQTKREQISMPNMKPVDSDNHMELLDGRVDATHVVTGVTYGVQAFMVFESESLNTSDKRLVTQNLKAALDLIIRETPAGVELNYGSSTDTTTEYQAYSRIRCTYYGDILQTDSQIPTNYEEAKVFCSKLPSFVESQGGVPIEITLSPLPNFLNKDKTFHEIHNNVLTMILDHTRELEQMMARCNALTQHNVRAQFPGYGEVFSEYHRQICYYLDKFKQETSKLILEIRRGSCDADKMIEAVTKSKNSPFGTRQLSVWIKQREQVLSALEGLLSSLPGIQVIETQEKFLDVANDENKNFVICLALPPAIQSETYLSDLKRYMEKPDKKLPGHNFDNFELNFERNVRGFYRENKNDKLKFVMTTFGHKNVTISNRGSILLFKRGELDKKAFEPPGQPDGLKCEQGENSSAVNLSWTPPRHVKCVDKYIVKYGPSSGGQIKEESTSKTKLTITDLAKNTYEFQVFASCAAGTSQGSNKVTQSVKGSSICTVM